MEISKDMVGAFAMTEVGGPEMTDALNAIQRCYDAYMGPFWAAVEAGKDKDRTMKEVAARGFAFVIGLAAFHTIHMHGASEEVEEFTARAVGEVAAEMRKTLMARRKAEREKGQA